MRVNFSQGIIVYPTSLSQQVFLQKTGNFVSLQTVNGRVDLTFCHGPENYLFTEASNVQNAWGPLVSNTDYWLYWDIDTLTAVRTFGFTTIQPISSPTTPLNPQNGQHWFDTKVNVKKMFVYQGGKWRNVIRLFAAKINNAIFTGLGPLGSYSGSQVGLNNIDIVAGRIISDNTGKPIRRVAGQFFTTEDDFFINGSPINVIRLEANVFQATALENMAKYQVSKLSQFGKINLATYNDIQNTVIAMTMEHILQGQTGTLCAQGVVTNPDWNFTNVGAPLWVGGFGLLTEVDANVVDPINYPIGKSPVARVISPTSIMFDQGMGGKGDKGLPGDGSVKATNLVYGITKLSVAAVNPENPIAVGDNDPRLIPYVHPSTHPDTIITSTPYSFLTGGTVHLQLQQLADRTLDSLSNVAATVPVLGDYLKYNGTEWINSPLPPVFQSIPIEMMNFMGNGIIDAPIDPNNPGRGDTSAIESGKFSFDLVTLTNLDNITNIPANTLLYLRVIVNGTTTHEISFNSSSMVTFLDIVVRANDILNPFNIDVTYSTRFDEIFLSNVSLLNFSSSLYSITSIEIIGGRENVVSTNQNDLLLALISYATGLTDLHIANHINPPIQPNYLNYAGEYYIAGNVPAPTPPTPPVFYWEFINQTTPVNNSLPLSWPPSVVPYSFAFNTNYGYSGAVAIDPALVTTLGELKTHIETFSPFIFNINTTIKRIEMYIPFVGPPPIDLTLLQITDGLPGVFDPAVGALALYTADDTGGLTAELDIDIYGTVEVLYPGALGHIRAALGDLVVYDTLGQWKVVGKAVDILTNKKIGIALNPESRSVAVGSFAGFDGRIVTYPSTTEIPTVVGDNAIVVSKNGLYDDINEKTILTKVQYPIKHAWKLSDVTSDTSLLSNATSFLGVTVDTSFNVTINYTASNPFFIITLTDKSQVYTISDLVDDINKALYNSGVYCVYQPTTNIQGLYDNNTICFVQTSTDLTANGVIIDVVLQAVPDNSYIPPVTIITSTIIPIVTVWETISTNAITYNTQASSNILTPITSRVPSWTIGGNHTTPHSYRVNTKDWNRTGEFNKYPLHYDEIVNLRWVLGQENLTISTSATFNDRVKVLGVTQKTTPLNSIIPLNDSRFKPIMKIISDNLGGLVGSDISMKIWLGTIPQDSTNDEDSTVVEHVYGRGMIPYDGEHGYICDIFIRAPRNPGEKIVNMIVCPQITSQVSNTNFNDIPVKQGQTLLLMSTPQKAKSWIEIQFKNSNSKVPYYENAGVYNKTGLSNTVTYPLTINFTDPVGTSGFHSIKRSISNTINTGATTYRNTIYSTITGGDGTTLAKAFNVNATFPVAAETYYEKVSFYVVGPGTITLTASHTGNTINQMDIYDASVDLIEGVSPTVFQDIHLLTTPTTFTHVLPDQKPYKVVLQVIKNTPISAPASVSYDDIRFVASSLGLVLDTVIDINKQTYDTVNPSAFGYDITTIKGLIHTLNVIIGPLGTTSTPNEYSVGWSFDGKVIIQSQYDNSLTMVTNVDGGFGKSLVDLGIPVTHPANIITTFPAGFLPNGSAYELDNGVVLSVPLLPNDQTEQPSISGNIPGYFDPNRGETI